VFEMLRWPIQGGHHLVPYLSFEPGQTKAFDIILPVPLARE
jgi:hypothetical protein